MTIMRGLAIAALAIPLLTITTPADAGGYGYGYHKPHRVAHCIAVAFRGYGDGPRIPGTRAHARAKFVRRACRRAVRRCYRRLSYRPHGPYARCRVVRSGYRYARY